MNIWFRFFFRIIPVFFLFHGGVAGQGWMHGSLYLPKVPDGFVLNPIGQGRQTLADARKVVSSRIRLSGQAEESLLLSGSNGLHLSFNGKGHLAFERFEQRVSAGQLKGESRSILSMNAGRLEIDSRQLAEGSQVLLELPIGRVLMDSVLCSILLESDVHSKIYRFEFNCAKGSIRFTDRSGESYMIQGNQVIMGAGSSSNPSLEISDLDERMADKMEAFVVRCRSELSALDENSMEWLSQMSLVSGLTEAFDADPPKNFANPEGKKPYVIEFSPKPKLLIPRYGIVQSLLSDED
ncbi:MAG: hypothetical protein ACON39_01980 [Coraliomargaritaceae bacterium]